jgi:hypothetical protein
MPAISAISASYFQVLQQEQTCFNMVAGWGRSVQEKAEHRVTGKSYRLNKTGGDRAEVDSVFLNATAFDTNYNRRKEQNMCFCWHRCKAWSVIFHTQACNIHLILKKLFLLTHTAYPLYKDHSMNALGIKSLFILNIIRNTQIHGVGNMKKWRMLKHVRWRIGIMVFGNRVLRIWDEEVRRDRRMKTAYWGIL